MSCISTVQRYTFIKQICATPLLLLCAIAAVEAAPKIAPCDTGNALQNVTDLLRRNQYDAAAKALDRLRQCPDLSAPEVFQIGWLYGRARHFGTALEIFRSIPDDVPNRLTHAYAVALSTFELGKYKDAIQVLHNLQARGRFDATCANLLAVSYSKLGLYTDAYEVLAAEIKKNPRDLAAYLNLVTVCAEGGNLPKAAQVALQATQRFPNSTQSFIVLGAANIDLGNLSQAYEDFQSAARLSPNSGEAQFFLALTNYKQDKFLDAMAVLRSALKRGIQDSDLHYLMAECLLKADPNDSSAIIAELNSAIDLNKHFAAARTLRGRLLLKAGHPKQAITDLQAASQDDPGSTSAIYNLARAYRALGRTQKAETLFKKLRKRKETSLDELSDRRVTEALEQRRTRK